MEVRYGEQCWEQYLGQLFASVLSPKMWVTRLRCSSSHDMITVHLNVAHCVRDSIFRDPIVYPPTVRVAPKTRSVNAQRSQSELLSFRIME